MNDAIGQIRARIGPPPRRLGWFQWWRLQVKPPNWMTAADDLMEIFLRQKKLLKEGEVYWSHIVQANRQLFEAGDVDCPAMVIFTADNHFDNRIGELQALARRLFELKSTTPDDSKERRLAEMITDEMERGLGAVVPKSLTGDRRVRSTTIMVFRKHLPGGILRNGLLPILVHPDTPAVMIVPQEFWPTALTEIWSG